MPRISPAALGSLSALSANPETQLVMAFSVAPPKNMQITQSASPSLLPLSVFPPPCSEIFISGIGETENITNEKIGSKARKAVRYCQFSVPKSLKYTVLIITTVTTP